MEACNHFYNNFNNSIHRAKYNFVKINGQRIYSSTGLKTPILKGCEVFVGGIPRDVFEDELIPIFESIGTLCQLRMMVNFCNMHRGYCFVTYHRPELASLAVTLLNAYEVRPGKKLGVYKSFNNCVLFIGGIPVDKNRQEVYNALKMYVQGIKDVVLYKMHGNKDLNRGYAFVEFEEHKLAAIARRRISPGSLVLWGQPIFMNWADPLPEVDPCVMARMKKLFLSNLDISVTKEQLWEIISNYIDEETVTKLYKAYDYAFLHFDTRTAAETALNALTGILINNQLVGVEWGRPRIYSKAYRQLNPRQHFCKSTSPRFRMELKQRRMQHDAIHNHLQDFNHSEMPLHLPSNSMNSTVRRRVDEFSSPQIQFVHPSESHPERMYWSSFNGTTGFEDAYNVRMPN